MPIESDVDITVIPAAIPASPAAQIANQQVGLPVTYVPTESGTVTPTPTPTPAPSAFDMGWEWAPDTEKLGEMFGYSNSGGLPGITSLIFNGTHTGGGLQFNSSTELVSISCPNLLDIDAANDSYTGLELYSLSALETCDFPVLQEIGYSIYLEDLPLESISFPALTTVGGGFDCLSMPALTDVSFPVLNAVGDDVYLNDDEALESVEFPALTSVSGSFDVTGMTALTSISLPVLATVGGNLLFPTTAIPNLEFPALETVGQQVFITNSPVLESVDLSALVTAGEGLVMSGNESLTTVTLTAYVPTSGQNQNLSGCALTEETVNHVLARCVANAAYVLGTIDLRYGTNAAPSGQGAADKITLAGRGVTVHTA